MKRREAYRVFLLISILIVLLAAALRIHHISQRSLWLDEAVAANISRGTLAETFTLTRREHSAPGVHPLVLYAVEKVSAGPLAVRIPSLVASVLAVIVMLCLVRIRSIGYQTAALSALMLGVSAVQVRYAQEAREYSLAVLYAGVLLYCFLFYTSSRDEDHSPVPLYLSLFITPFVQYGLVLFGCGVLAALFVLAFFDSKDRRRISHLGLASGCLALGGLLSFFLTLRYQWGDPAWYLKDYYFAPGSGLLRFAWSNTHHLITTFLPGLGAAAISVAAILAHLVTSVRARIVSPLTVLAFTSVGTVLVCAVLHLYPYGAIRQCLFLSSVLCVFAAAGLVQVTSRFTGFANLAIFAAIVCIVVVSGLRQFRLVQPYAEVEDIQQVLLGLRNHIEPGDGVYIYPGAVPAVDFYVKNRDPRFTYGDFHQQAPEKYASEMLVGFRPETNRFWIVFSHIYHDEDQRILHDLSADWKVDSVLSVQGSALYLACRRRTVVDGVSTNGANPVIDAAKGELLADQRRDTFWDWNIRNSRRPGQ
jgi:hypothetical protein